MALSPQFLDELKHRFTLSDVVGRQVKLVRRGREHTGCCPFHNEKTPSFTVNDVKGFYHCFGCGAHGSVYDFIINSQGMTFIEAVEMLAAEAGVEVPKPSPEAQEAQKMRSTLYEVMELAAKWYAEQLHTMGGKFALDYVKGRGLSDQTIKEFGIGYSPKGRSGLKDFLLSRDVEEQQLIDTGLVIKPDDGSASYDRFRDRLMFPITDRQGHHIAFGGRALSKDAKAKYLNSPETVLFHKGATLYNWGNARKAAYNTGQILVVEGYMDVIALAQFGIIEAVAPLGTALTEEQMAHLWQMADEPVLCFDGDNAGQKAAGRAMERALPHLKAGKSLRFALLPEGDDPDTLVQRDGRKAMDTQVDQSIPLVDMLWNHLTVGADGSTPERRAGLEKKTFGMLNDIADEGIKKLYQQEFRRRFYERFAPVKKQQNQANKSFGAGFKKGSWKKQTRHGSEYVGQTGGLGRTLIARQKGTNAVAERLEKLLLLSVVYHPEILMTHEDTFMNLEFQIENLKRIQTAILDYIVDHDFLDGEKIEKHIRKNNLWEPIEKMATDPILKKDWFVWSKAALSDTITGFEHVLSRFHFLTDVKADYIAAEREYAEDMTSESHERFVAAQEAYRAAEEKIANIDNYGLESNRIHSV